MTYVYGRGLLGSAHEISFSFMYELAFSLMSVSTDKGLLLVENFES